MHQLICSPANPFPRYTGQSVFPLLPCHPFGEECEEEREEGEPRGGSFEEGAEGQEEEQEEHEKENSR